MSIVIAICAALVGLLLVAATGAATGRITVPPKGTHRKIDIQPKKLPWAILIGIVFLLWTHLVLAAVVAAGLPYLLPALRLKNPQAAVMARLEGLVSWSEALRDQVRSTGIEEALRRASTPPPPALERELSNLVANLDPRVALSTGEALRRFADDMADPACDTIIAPLIMSVEQQAKGVADLLSSSLDDSQLARIKATPGVRSAVGVLVETERLNAANPLFLEIGIQPQDLKPFGVQIVAGHAYTANAPHQVMLGWRAAQNLGYHVGSVFHTNGTSYTVVGIYSTGISFGDLGSMFPLPTLQAYNRVPGSITMAFVKVAPGASIPSVEHQITENNPVLTTIRTAAQFGRADRNLVFLQAAASGSTVLAIVIGAVIVGNAMLLSLFERTREFGLLRAVGWSRWRVLSLMLGEAIVLGLIGVAAGVGLSFLAVTVLESLPNLHGVLHTTFTAGIVAKGLATGLAMTVIGTLYPALRAAFLKPLEALSHE